MEGPVMKSVCDFVTCTWEFILTWRVLHVLRFCVRTLNYFENCSEYQEAQDCKTCFRMEILGPRTACLLIDGVIRAIREFNFCYYQCALLKCLICSC